jgi:signal peptidase
MLAWHLHKVRLQASAFAIWLAAGFVFTILLSTALPSAIGMRSFTVRSGSMSPAIETGDMVVARRIDPGSARPGDIVTFNNPQGGDLTTHRVRSVRRAGDKYRFITRGDANNTSEDWSVVADGEIGQIAYRVPKLGFILSPTNSGRGRLLLIGIPALLLCALGLIRIWRPEQTGAVIPLRRSAMVELLSFRRLPNVRAEPPPRPSR